MSSANVKSNPTKAKSPSDVTSPTAKKKSPARRGSITVESVEKPFEPNFMRPTPRATNQTREERENAWNERVKSRNDTEKLLLKNLRERYGDLKALFEKYSSHWEYEDPIYRYYHKSFKVYGLQRGTVEIANALQALAPNRVMNGRYRQVVFEGTGKIFRQPVNDRWDAEIRPIVEAFFHSRYFLEMAVRYGKKFKIAPTVLPSGWASLLYLYDAISVRYPVNENDW